MPPPPTTSPWDLLGIPHDASPDVVKQAYRRLALRHHPDRDTSPGAAERFRRLHEAYRQALARPQPPRCAPAMSAPVGRRPSPPCAERPVTPRERLLFNALHATGLCFAVCLLLGVLLAFLGGKGMHVQLFMALPGLAILPDSIDGLRLGTRKAGP
ncbi:MAG: J domain-containing protein [Flavobacteriales bacterium]|nr:J domain-containing protein [Flavobacteriales bacterium]